jgi:hypothetical protein
MSRLPAFAAVVMIAFAAAPAAADDGWTPVPAPPQTVPAGATCSFAVHIEAVKNEVVSKVVATHRDGSPRTVLYKGDLVERLTNLANGRSIIRDSGAFGINDIADDGASTWTFIGPIVWGFALNDPITPGLYAMDGLHVVTLSADGSSERMLVDDGPKENLCATLR